MLGGVADLEDDFHRRVERFGSGRAEVLADGERETVRAGFERLAAHQRAEATVVVGVAFADEAGADLVQVHGDAGGGIGRRFMTATWSLIRVAIC